MFKVGLNTEASRAAIRRAMAQMSDMTPMYEDIVEYMIGETKKRFVEGIDPNGKKWAAKSKTTLEHYKRLGYGNFARLKPLIGHTGYLSQGIVGSANRHGALIGSALIYSRVMQDGAAKGAFGADRRGRPIPWGRIPARAWLGLSQKNEAHIIEIVDDHLNDALSGKV